ncbi:MAG TPA: hypothetical protein VGR07_20325 [Thermoanaerobaculia bacterium]|jgi:hypothetical protein|nr:hypothetical protein [Thermoanaerobaculia bacterium]
MQQSLLMAQSRSTAPLLEKIVRLSLSAGAIDIANYEQAEAGELRAELVPVVGELLKDALAFFDGILDTYGADEDPGPGGESPPGNFRREVDELLLAEVAEVVEAHGERIADLTFIARLELRQKMASLTRLPAEADSWRIIAAAGSCLRQIHKALAALEAVITRAEGVAPVLGFNDELTSALAARRAYAGFRRQLRHVGRLPDISDRLQGAATSIAHLFDLEVYRDLRISDRVQLRRLLERILRWAGPDLDREGGERLWEDLSACAALLAEISKRQELQEHDTRACQEILDRLVAAPLPGPALPADVRPLLESLTGRDDDLDDRIFDGGRIDRLTAAVFARRLAGTRSCPPQTPG